MDSSVSQDPVVVEPVVNTEKLRELLAWGTEYPTLDFKSECDPSLTRDLVELAKDVGAMSVRGGFLVIGVDKRGRPTGAVTDAQASLFDEARLRPKLLKYLPDSLQICCQDHDLPGGKVVLVHVAANPAGCAFFRADGQYQPPGKSESKVVFREGEVFFRSGTESKRLNQQGLELVIEQRVRRARERWLDDHASEYRRLADELRAGMAGQRVSSGPAVEFNLALESEVLVEATVELLRAGDDIPLRRLLHKVAPEARSLYRAGDEQAVDDLLDQVTRLAATFLNLDRQAWLHRTTDSLVAIYDMAFEGKAEIINEPPQRAAALWLKIIERVEALGALAVRREAWAAVRDLASRKPVGMHHMYASWLRHATTMANRAGIVPSSGGVDTEVSMISCARDTIRRLAELRPDLEADDERILTSLNQFDFLACVVALAATNNDGPGGVYYPHFAKFYGSRTRPIAERLIADQALRQQVYPGDDRQLAEALRQIDGTARQVGFRYDGWEGYSLPVRQFVDANLTG
ncbi:AlbA family DNA-binding domain-containing protein [Micromonospora palythoicola]|uniref:AlbA family DNA-binding domain-containing protein n=1 Tax=Micromonospora palythoicola TaxID=3120507 RepID=UPI002FCDE3C6